MIKGDKIKLVKPIGVFVNIGEECEVLDITKQGVISFRFGENNLGCISFNEYKKHFKLVDPKPEELKNNWTAWEEKSVKLPCIAPGVYSIVNVEFRHNKNKVQVKYNGLKSEATCCKYDKFDLDKGFKLACFRLSVKILDLKVKDFAKNM